MDSLIEYLEFNDYDVRLAAARSLKFLSSNKNIKAKLRDNMVVTSKMVTRLLLFPLWNRQKFLLPSLDSFNKLPPTI